MSRHVHVYSQKLNAEDLGTLAGQYQAAYGLPTAVRTSAPNLTAQAEWPGLLDQPDEAVLRYWSAQTNRLSAMLAEAYPPLEGAVVQDSALTLLASSWDDDTEGTVVYNRELADHGLAIVLQGMEVDSGGRLRVNGAALPLPPRSALVTAETPAAQDGGGSEVQQAMWIILKYIGEGLSEGEPPIIGTIFSVLLELFGLFSQTSSDQMSQLLDDIKKLLQEDRIQIEMDEANAVVLTWSQYEGSHFQQSDLTTLNQGDSSSPAYKAAQERVSAFVTKINGDLNGTPRLFDAVNLMRGDTGENPDTLDFPDDAMLKFSYFMFYAGFILALGKQAWLASKALNGNNADVTQSLQKEVAYLSSNYTTYVNQLSSSINAQVSTRIGRWSVQDGNPIDGHTFIFIYDSTTDRGARYYPPSDWGYTGDTVFSYCGNAQRNQAIADCNAALTALTTCYQNYMYGRIVKVASDGRTLQQEFNARVAAFQDNDKKYQNLAANG
jgi:hypothetical protein